MRYLEQAAVLLALCILSGVLWLSRQEAPAVETDTIAAPSAYAVEDRPADGDADHAQRAAHGRPATRSSPVLGPAELVTLPRQIQEQAGAATIWEREPAGGSAAARPAIAEHIVLGLPWQIQQQVARTVLTPAPLFREAEILTLPWQIQAQVRQAHQAPTP